MRVIKVKPHQSLFDIALQEYGDVEGVYLLVEDNNLTGIIDSLLVDQKLLVREEAINIRQKKYLNPHTIATGETARGEGIGFWYIKNDFVVS